tara:strand:+ start:183 stop:860 length:678 start_codon:yes stop_codon:yes gene_type:complete
MINKTDKFNILLIIIIIIIIGFCLFSNIDNFVNGRSNLNITSSELDRSFLGGSIFSNEHNLYFIANMDYRDNKHLYFINHNLGAEKIKIKDTKIEDKIPKIVFKIIFQPRKNTFSFQSVIIKPDGDTVPPGKDVKHLNRVRFIPYRFIPNSRIKIQKNIKYFMINSNVHMLQRVSNNKRYSLDVITKLKEKHRHIFFLIPYYCSSQNIKTTNVTQGKNCIWRYFK